MSQLSLQVIMIDNYDSFTYNLVDQFRRLGAEVIVFRNTTPIKDIFTPERLANKNSLLIISPGPGNPDSAGNCLQILEQYIGKIPILGICLGHQAIVQHYGGVIAQADEIIHGKSDDIYFVEESIFEQLGNPISVARYHSLIAHSVPESLEIIGYTKNKEVMAVTDRKNKVLGFQFHPESILTTQGSQLLKLSINYLTKKIKTN